MPPPPPTTRRRRLATGSQYEIQIWHWDFLSQPFDANYGSLTDRFIFEINTGRALRERNSKIARSQTPCHQWSPCRDEWGRSGTVSDIAIRADGLSKLYKIGALKQRHDMLRDQLVYGVKSLFSGSGRRSPQP